METVLAVERVTKRFGKIRAVNDITFSVGRSEVISLLGPSGCGKTTTLRVVAGFETPEAGRVVIEAEDVTRHRPYERNVGLLFQNYALFPHMTVSENIAYGLRHRGWPRHEREARTRDMLDLVHLSEFAERRPDRLSGGQQQRVALARALATRPQVLLLDEPLSALDAKLRQELRVELKNILRTVGSTAIIVTHDQEEAMGMAERILVMSHGVILQEGSPDEIYSRPTSKFVAEFVGRSNWFRGRLGENLGDARQLVTDSGLKFRVHSDCDVNDEIEVCLRPERIDLVPAQADSITDSDNILDGCIRDCAHLGMNLHFLVELRTGEQVAVAETNRPHARVSVGENVLLRFQPSDCIVLPASPSENDGS